MVTHAYFPGPVLSYLLVNKYDNYDQFKGSVDELVDYKNAIKKTVNQRSLD